MTALLIKCRDFAVEDRAFSRQELQGIEQLRVIEGLLITRDQADVFAVFEGQGAVAIEFDFVQPIALRQLLDREGFHGSMKEGIFWVFAFTIGQYPMNVKRSRRRDLSKALTSCSPAKEKANDYAIPTCRSVQCPRFAGV